MIGVRSAARAAAALGSAMVLAVAFPASAWAGVEPAGACDGTATIEGTTFTPANDTPGNPVVVPADRSGLTIPYTGMVTFENMNHSGRLYLDTPLTQVFGPDVGRIPVASWSDPNDGDLRQTADTYALDQLWNRLGFHITGLVRLSGEHAASGGSCSGFVYVEFTGSPLGTPIGIAVVAGTVLTGALVVWAGVPKRGG